MDKQIYIINGVGGALIRSLCSEDTSFVTGQVIAATGGFMI